MDEVISYECLSVTLVRSNFSKVSRVGISNNFIIKSFFLFVLYLLLFYANISLLHGL